jgi:hypothetical protein
MRATNVKTFLKHLFQISTATGHANTKRIALAASDHFKIGHKISLSSGIFWGFISPLQISNCLICLKKQIIS